MTMRKKVMEHADHSVSINILYSGAVTLDCSDCESLVTMWKLENEDEENDWRMTMRNDND
jgi:hypothetical protein